MKKIIFSLFLVLSTNVFSSIPTVESAEKMLELSQAEKGLDVAKDSVRKNIKSMVLSQVKADLKQEKISEQHEKMIEEFLKIAMPKMDEVFEQNMSWANYRSMHINIIQKTFSQQEVDQINEFYMSPIGKIFVQKMPIMIENIVKETTVLNVELERAMQKILQECEKESNQRLIRGDDDRILWQ